MYNIVPSSGAGSNDVGGAGGGAGAVFLPNDTFRNGATGGRGEARKASVRTITVDKGTLVTVTVGSGGAGGSGGTSAAGGAVAVNGSTGVGGFVLFEKV